MIRFTNLKQLLLKALKPLHSSSPHHYIMVERLVVKQGMKPFKQKFRVRADQVQATDKVISGHHNLPQNHPHKPAVITPYFYTKSTPPAVKKKAEDYYKTFSSDQEFFDTLKHNGVDWDETTKAGTLVSSGMRMMRAKMALNAAIQNGADPSDFAQLSEHVEDLTQQIGTIIPNVQFSSALDSPEEPVFEPEPETDESLIKVPDDATEEQKEYVKFINNMTDLENIRRCSIIGVVPEDPVIEQYLSKVMLPEMVKAHNKTDSEDGHMAGVLRDGFKKDVTESGADLGTVEVEEWEVTFDDEWKNFARTSIDAVKLFWKIKNYDEDNFIASRFYRHISMKSLVDPVNTINFNSPRFERDGTNVSEVERLRPVDIIGRLNEAFNDYGTDVYQHEHRQRYLTNSGYIGFAPKEYQDRYNVNKEGFVRYLHKIERDSSGNPDVKERIDHMINNYNKIMELCNHNPHILRNVLQSSSFSSKQMRSDLMTADKSVGYLEYLANGYGTMLRFKGSENHKFLATVYKHMTEGILKVLQNEGCNYQDILDTLKNNIQYTYPGFPSYRIVKNGQEIGEVDLSEKWKELYPEDLDILNTSYSITPQLATVWNPLIVYQCLKQQEPLIQPDDATNEKINQILGSRIDTRPAYIDDNPIHIRDLVGLGETLEALKSLTNETFWKIHQLADDMFGVHLPADIDENSKISQLTLKVDEAVRGDNFVYSNLLLGTITHSIKARLAQNSSIAPSKDIKSIDYLSTPTLTTSNTDQVYYRTAIYQFWQRSIDVDLSKDWGQAPTNFSLNEMNQKIQYQLDSSMSYNWTEFNQVQDYYQALSENPGTTIPPSELANEDAFSQKPWITVKDMDQTNPLSELNFKYLDSLAASSHLWDKYNKSSNVEGRQKVIAKRLGYTAIDYGKMISDIQNANAQKLQELLQMKSNVPSNDLSNLPVVLKAARQRLYDKAVCSVRTEPPEVSEAMRQDVLENKFDYKPGETTPDGSTVSAPVHTGRLLFFNTPFFTVQNTTLWKQRFESEKQRMISNGADAKCYEELDVVHGCARWSLPSILGCSQGWFMGEELQASGKMLGAGAYFGNKWGKSTPYAGNKPYANIGYSGVYGCKEGDADGMMMTCKIMRGDNFSTEPGQTNSDNWSVGTPEDMKLTSLSDDIKKYHNLEDFEICIKRNELILPEHFVDVSCREKYTNVAIDQQGNYYEYNQSYEDFCNVHHQWRNNGKVGPEPKWTPSSDLTPKWDKNHKLIGMVESPEDIARL